jgi:benzaldehyde dehydrogenase (NAD)
MTFMDAGSWSGKVFIGSWVAGGAGDAPVIEPATGEELERSGRASAADASGAAERAVEAQRSWAQLPYTERAAVLRRAGDLWRQHASDVSEWLVREAGSIPPKAEVEIEFAASACHDAAGLASLAIGEVLPTTMPHISLTRRVPIGVIGIISPFNFPLILSIRAVAPALALGNAVILKPDPRTAVCGGVTLARIFEEAGLPAGVLSVLPGGAEVGEAMIGEAHIGLVSFTGSTRVGRRVAALAAERLKPVHLELGGNSALVILDDVDPEMAASVGAFGSFNHQGQICMTTGRHIVARPIVDRYSQALGEHARNLPVGNPATEQVALGPLIDDGQRDRVHEMVTASVSAGARLVEGGTYSGRFYRPTVLADIPTEAPAYAQEVFGPVAPIVAFDTIDEAVELAGAGAYGLALGVLTGDVMRALEIAGRIPAGIVHVNDQTVGDEVVNPFGGVRDTGGSRLGGVQANLETFTVTQWVTLRSTLPQYPF